MLLHDFHEQAPLPADKILQVIRLWIEERHREFLLPNFTNGSYMPCAIKAIGGSCCGKLYSLHQDISSMRATTAEQMCNKTVPIYVTASGDKDAFAAWHSLSFDAYIAESLFYWLYSRWFRPYRSNVEFGRFIAHPIHPVDLAPGMEPSAMARDVVAMHRAICSQVDSMVGRPKCGPFWTPCNDGRVDCDPQFYLLQPIFRALIIIFPSQNCSLFNSDFSTIPVFLVLTGVTEGLTWPITFESLDSNAECKRYSDTLIQLPLEDAIAFVETVEARENAVYDHRPDLATMDQELYQHHLEELGNVTDTMVRLGWEGQPCLLGPSSEWVWNPKKYPDLAWKHFGIWRDSFKARLLWKHRYNVERLISNQELPGDPIR